jgi:hypothetical protein
MTPSGIEPAAFRFVAQYLNHCATAVPYVVVVVVVVVVIIIRYGCLFVTGIFFLVLLLNQQ